MLVKTEPNTYMLFKRVGSKLCGVFPAIHTLTGCDYTSRIGTKKAALKANCVDLLQHFGESTCMQQSKAKKSRDLPRPSLQTYK